MLFQSNYVNDNFRSLSPISRSLVFLLFVRCNNNKCWPSIRSIHKDLGFSKTKIINCIKELENKKVIHVFRSSDKNNKVTNFYSINLNFFESSVIETNIMTTSHNHSDLPLVHAMDHPGPLDGHEYSKITDNKETDNIINKLKTEKEKNNTTTTTIISIKSRSLEEKNISNSNTVVEAEEFNSVYKTNYEIIDEDDLIGYNELEEIYNSTEQTKEFNIITVTEESIYNYKKKVDNMKTNSFTDIFNLESDWNSKGYINNKEIKFKTQKEFDIENKVKKLSEKELSRIEHSIKSDLLSTKMN